MSMSLRDQLLQAGLVNEKQARDAERQAQLKQDSRQQLPKKKRDAPSAQEIAAQHSALAKAARDTELNRKHQEKADRKARHAQIKQLIEQHRLPKVEGDEFYSFVDGKKIRRIFADAATRERIIRGEVSIVRCQGRYDLVPAETAARIGERDERAVMAPTVTSVQPPVDAVYAQFAVPDDLVW